MTSLMVARFMGSTWSMWRRRLTRDLSKYSGIGKTPAIERYYLSDTVWLTFDLSEKTGNVFVVEGKSSTEKGVEDDTTRPDIHLGTGIQSEETTLNTNK